MATAPVTQLYDKTIFANKSTPLYRYARLVLSNGKKQVPYKTAEKGDTIGVVFSHIDNKDGIWLMFKEPKALGGRSYYMLYNKANVDTTSLKEQGVKTDQQIEKEQEDKDLYQKSKLEYFIKKYGIWILITIVAIPVIKTYVQKKL
jgi:hypothetical protein